MEYTPEFGIQALGIFVGAILGFGLAKAGGNLKSALTVLGAALGGGPIIFLEIEQPKLGLAIWAYPVGLVIGVLLIRLWFAREAALDRRASKGKRLFA